MFRASINFRATAGYVEDGEGETYCIGDTYPTTRNGLTFGWVGATATRDRSVVPDRRLAGQQTVGLASVYFRLDLDSAGTHKINLAAGDYGSTNHTWWDVRDGASTVLLSTTGESTSAAFFRDAQDTLHAAADWPNDEEGKTVEFKGTQLRLYLSAGWTTGNTAFAHLKVTGPPEKIPLGPVFIKRPWTKQPPAGTPINWSHPLAKDLVFFSLYGQDATKTLRTGHIFPGTARIPTKLGQGELYTGGAPHGVEWHQQRPFKVDGPQTLLHYGNAPPDAVKQLPLLGQRYIGGGGPYPMTVLAANADLDFNNVSGKVLSYTQNDVGDEVSAITNNVVLDGDYHWIATTKDSTVSNSTKIYIDGVSQAITHQTGGATQDATGWADNDASFATGLWAEGSHSGASLAGQIGVVNAAWTRALTEEEINQFQDNPWQVFKPKTIFAGKPDALNQRLVMF